MKCKHLKHLFTALLLLCATVATAHDFEVGGIYYNILSETDKTVDVTCSGTYSSFVADEYTGKVAIPESVVYGGITYSVTSIGGGAFAYCTGLTSVEIPNSVTNIGNGAFAGCTGLTSVEIPNSVTSIGHYAFEDCTGLTSIEIPNSVTNIGNGAFEYCKGLTSITIPNSVTSIGVGAFAYCTGLTSITIPNSVTNIGGYAFDGTAWYNNQPDGLVYVGKVLYEYKGTMPVNTSIVIKDSTIAVSGYAFYGCTGLTSITIPNSVTSIGESAFEYCSGLTSIEIPNSVTSIGYFAFNNCYCLTSVEIPNSVTSIGDYAFDGTAWYNNQPDGLVYVGKVLYEYKGTMPVNTSIVIKDSTIAVSSYAFKGCTGLTSITIPNSVTSIGSSAFFDCTGLTSVEIPNSVTSIGSSAFRGCSGLTSVTSLIPADELFAIDLYVFYNVDKTTCTLYVPYGAKETYAATKGWNEFTNIVELEPTATEVTVTIGQYGNATYCSPYALDFSNVEGLKAYNAIGYKPSTQTVTLARVMTTGAGQGVFIKGEPGEYTVPIIDNFDEYTLNLLVGTLEATTVNSTDGEMSNYKFTIAAGDAAPMFYPFEDGTTLSAGKAYLQIPTAWLPATAQKSLNIRFDEGKTTDIDEVKGENGKVKIIYDLQGRVVENPTSGIYIINGKKVVVK